MIKEEDIQAIGQFAKPHGTKGEIALYTDYEFNNIANVYLVCCMDGLWTPFFLTSCRQKNTSCLLVSFEHLESAEKVKVLMGKTAFIPKNKLQTPNPTALRSSDLTVLRSYAPTVLRSSDLTVLRSSDFIGFTVVDPLLGTIGLVTGVNDRTLNTLLIVDYQGNEIFIPTALASSIEYELKILNVSLPEGFLELTL